MTGNRTAARRAVLRNRIIALGAAGLVLGAGATSMAAWTDSEYVAGGVGSEAGVTSSTFNVQQSVASDAGAFTDRETAAAAGVVDFSDAASQLSPGATVYGYVRLRTVVDSAGGSLSLVSDTDAGSGLAAVLTYRAVVLPDYALPFADTCNAAAFTSPAADHVLAAAGSALDTATATTFDLAASDGTNPGAEKTVCFAITFPDTPENEANHALQGQTVDPVWHFAAISD